MSAPQTQPDHMPMSGLSAEQIAANRVRAQSRGRRVIVVGTGIAGMMAAYLLSREYDVQVFEAGDYIGGHTATIDVREGDRTIPVDTGFIVCNPLAYPGLMRLFDEIGVATQESLMSFSVSDRVTGFEFGSYKLNNTFAQRRNLVNPRFWRFILDYFRFNREGAEAIGNPAYENHTLGQFLAEKRYSRMFVRQFIIPATSAIWSTPYKFTFEYPIQSLFRFYKNHGLLGGRRTKWRTVVGGSKAYVPRITAPYKDRIHLRNAVIAIRRAESGVIVKLADGSECEADHVVTACHSDQALGMLSDASATERDILGDIPYLGNEVILHTDARFMPCNRRAWESWNYLLYADEAQSRTDYPVTMTYYSNLLQNLGLIGAKNDYFVTVNPQEPMDPAKVIRRFTYHHPQYDFKAVRAQSRLPEINGIDRTHFCGAWCRYGFHEDGLQSAVTVAANMGVAW